MKIEPISVNIGQINWEVTIVTVTFEASRAEVTSIFVLMKLYNFLCHIPLKAGTIFLCIFKWIFFSSPPILAPDVQEGAGRGILLDPAPLEKCSSLLLCSILSGIKAEMWPHHPHPGLLLPFSTSFEPFFNSPGFKSLKKKKKNLTPRGCFIWMWITEVTSGGGWGDSLVASRAAESRRNVGCRLETFQKASKIEE